MRSYELKHPNGYVVGTAVESQRGWRFMPLVTSHRPSRKDFPTADACLPAWARKWLRSGCSFLPRGQ